jgi:ornithine carbamoyltransferase
MADFLTLREKKGGLSNLKLAYVGDGNNIAHSLLLASAKAGTRMAIATPPGYEPEQDILGKAEEDGKGTGFHWALTSDPREAVRGADAVYTDTWASMGQEEDKQARIQALSPYQVNSQLMAEAGSEALFMHCLPAHRGEEVTDDVIDSPQSVVYDQAENRLHIQKTILSMLLGDMR